MPIDDSLCDLLISSYNVSHNFSDITKAILFEENIDTVGEVWEACNCNIYSPYFLTNIDAKQNSLLNEYLEKHKVIQRLDIPEYCRKWNVYELQTEEKLFFELISSELISKLGRFSSSDRAYWISQNTDLKKLVNILIHTENEQSNYSDLIYLQSFLDVTEWLYSVSQSGEVQLSLSPLSLIRRGVGGEVLRCTSIDREALYTFRRDFCVSYDHNFSLFISRNSKIIQEIDIFRQQKIINSYDSYLLGLNSHYDLLACF